MSAMPWNEYALRCELKLTLENDGDFMRDRYLSLGTLSGLRRDLCSKYNLSPAVFNGGYGAVIAALIPGDSRGRGYIPHTDSCIPSEDAYNRARGLGRYDVSLQLDTTNISIIAGKIVNSHKENIMSNKPIEITTRTYANGQDISTLSDSEVYELIAKEEAKIEELSKIKAQPKKLVAEIEKRQAGIAALVAYLDSKEAA